MRLIDGKITPEEREALAELAQTDRRAFAEVITEYVDPVYLTLDLMGQFMNTRELRPGDTLVKRFKGKYHVQQFAPGSITLGEQITIRDKAVSYNLDILSAKALYNELELRNGGPDFTPEQIKADVRSALDEQLVMRTWNALANIWTSGNASALTIPGATYSNYINVSGALTAAALDNAIDHTNYWAGGVRAIIGTEAALAPLSTFGQYQMIGGLVTYDGGKYVTQNGQPAGTIVNSSPFKNPYAVETYRGVTNIVRLKQIFDRTEFPPTAILPSNFVLVIGDNIGEFVTFGGPEVKEYVDNEPTPPNWTYETWQQIGMMIWNARGITKLEVTSTIP